jgi:glycosyltransferase involved in cell wall biosynthesis
MRIDPNPNSFSHSNEPAPTVSVVLSTFNGARFLAEQLDSLVEQRISEPLEILIRDDGSTDHTSEVLDQYRNAHPNLFRTVATNGRRIGPKESFIALLAEARGSYIAFCDQDDVWHRDKLARQLTALRELEARRSHDIPVLCCSDAEVTDAELNIIGPSYFLRHGLFLRDDREQRLARLLFRNYVIGATTMINRALADRCLIVPPEAIMHDWWAALIATCLGEVSVIRTPLIRYRQHTANAIGSRTRSFPRSPTEVRGYLTWTRKRTEACLRQARALAIAIDPDMTPGQRDLLGRYAEFGEQAKWRRAVTILATRAFKPGLLLNGVHMYACLRARP